MPSVATQRFMWHRVVCLGGVTVPGNIPQGVCQAINPKRKSSAALNIQIKTIKIKTKMWRCEEMCPGRDKGVGSFLGKGVENLGSAALWDWENEEIKRNGAKFWKSEAKLWHSWSKSCARRVLSARMSVRGSWDGWDEQQQSREERATQRCEFSPHSPSSPAHFLPK